MSNEPWVKRCAFLGFCLLLILILWGSTARSVASMADVPTYSTFHTGWSQVIDGQRYPLADIHDFQPVAPGEPLTFVCTLPELGTENVLLFYSEHREVTCQVGDQVIQQFAIDAQLSTLKTPGTTWNQVDLDRFMSGQECTLTFCAGTALYNQNLYDIYLMDNVDVDGFRFGYFWFHALVGFVLLALVWIVYVNGVVWKSPRRKRYFFAMGQVYLVSLMWLLADLNAYDLLFGRPVLSYLMEEFFVRLLPITVVQLAKNSTNRYDQPRILKALEWVSMVNFFLPWVTLLVFKVPILSWQGINYLVAGVIVLGLFIITVKKLRRFKMMDQEEYPCLALSFLLLGTTIDMVSRYFQPMRGAFSGLWTALGCLTYTAVTFVIFAIIDAKQTQEKRELDQAYRQLQNTSLVQQMKAHFIFNVLNTISAYCKEDAKKADHAIRTFAAYLRSYLFYINQQETITIQQELDMVQSYLNIEQMRFESKISYCVEMDYADFRIPPLTVQTLVENSVIHGIQPKSGSGEIRIRTLRTGTSAQVIISDTGVGFDTKKQPKDSSVGLSNVTKRVHIMSQGTVQIQSQMGQGTTVTITIPLA